MQPSPLTALRLAVVAASVTAGVTLTGCSAVTGVVEQILPERNSAHTLLVGECFNNTLTIEAVEGAVVDVPRENCTLAHDNEVIASVQLSDKTFPGDDTVLLQGFQACLPEFEKFIGVEFTEAGTLEYDFFVPSEASWLLGDREILCFVYDSAAQTAYSLKGKGAERLAATEGSDDAPAG